VTRLRAADAFTNLVIDPAGVTSLSRGDAQSIAWSRGHLWTLVARGDALYLVAR